MDVIKGYDAGDVIIEEGTKGTSAYIILSGTVEVTKRSAKGEVKMATLGERQVFGEMGLIEDRPRSATVKAMSELKVRVIDREHFNELLRTKPSVLIPILKSLFERLRQVSNMLAERAPEPGKEQRKGQSFEVVMSGQTAEAREALTDRQLLITKFPFLVGRESLNPEADVFYNNDLFIREETPYVVSRNHIAVTKEAGAIWVVDRGSAFGTIVNGKEIGGESGISRAPLDKKENQVIIGPVTSKYIFLLKVIPL